jgi:hypothetical protein
MAGMTLARAWRRQLTGASSAALIVPFAMLAALVVLALGGGFSQVGVLGQIFAGPPAPTVGAAADAQARGAAARSSLAAIPVIPGPSRSPARAVGGRPGGGRVVPVSTAAPIRTGGALAPVGGAAPIVTQGAGANPPTHSAPAPAPTHSSAQPPPSPQPQPNPTPVDQVVKVVTSVTQQVPAPAAPVATQAVQAAGSAADGVLGSGPSTPPGAVVP